MGSPPIEFDSWYEEQHPLVLAALTVASGRPDVAADATDEAFVRAYERWERVRRMASPGGWLYRVAFNDLRRRCRRQAIERELLRRQPPPAATAPTMPAPHVWEAVRRLPARQRTAVALRYVLDLTEPEVAKVMGVSRGSASASLATARRTLETWLADDDAGPQPGPEPTKPGLSPAQRRAQLMVVRGGQDGTHVERGGVPRAGSPAAGRPTPRPAVHRG